MRRSIKSFPLKIMNHIELPTINKVFQKGDVHLYQESEIVELSKDAGMQLELFEKRAGMR